MLTAKGHKVNYVSAFYITKCKEAVVMSDWANFGGGGDASGAKVRLG